MSESVVLQLGGQIARMVHVREWWRTTLAVVIRRANSRLSSFTHHIALQRV
jgi:hypothetical protein